MIKQYLQTPWKEAETSKAFVLMNVIQGLENHVVDVARALGNLKKARYCFGLYDLILELEADSFDDLKELVTHKYRTIMGVRSVLVLLITSIVGEENFNETEQRLEIFA